MREKSSPERDERSLGTDVGVFRPTFLTILGVILYLRVGWVVGYAGIAASPEREDAQAFLELIASEARLPSSTRLEVIVGAHPHALEDGPTADLHLLGLPGRLDRETLEGDSRKSPGELPLRRGLGRGVGVRVSRL